MLSRALLLPSLLLLASQPIGIPDYGYPRISILVDGQSGFVLKPSRPSAGRPWVWFAPVLQGQPNVHHAFLFRSLLARGIAVAGLDIGESYGSPEGRGLFSKFYTKTTRMGLSRHPCLLAQSRGGLMLFNWAAEHPQSVNCIAAIYPVLDLRSWPGLDHKELQAAYQETAAQLLQDLPNNNPIARLGPLEQAGVPILLVHGDADQVVPLGPNSGLVPTADRFARLIVIHGKGHEEAPEFFENRELLEFLSMPNRGSK
jgi:Prolyl oligopeptidase family